jgi:Fe-S-cluster-containing dehydrogenase component
MVNRRDFLKIAGTAAGTAALTAAGAQASESPHELDPDRYGVLTDTTLCIGCRRCEWACAEQNDLPHGSLDSYGDISVFKEPRRPDRESFTVVNRYSPPAHSSKHLSVKVQCLHCEHPACVSACIVTALEKSPQGPVVYDPSKCIGCRYCMIACPFQIPAYEYNDPLKPRVMKCTMCAERTLEEGRAPACVEMCPPEALVFGRRSDLLKLAHDRIRNSPDRYHPEVIGERIAGGTSWLMLADRPATKIGLPDLPDTSPAEITETIQHGIFKGFSGPLMLFGVLSILMKSSTDRRKEMEDENV